MCGVRVESEALRRGSIAGNIRQRNVGRHRIGEVRSAGYKKQLRFGSGCKTGWYTYGDVRALSVNAYDRSHRASDARTNGLGRTEIGIQVQSECKGLKPDRLNATG